MAGPITAAEVREWNGASLTADTYADTQLQSVCDAVTDLVVSWKGQQPDDWPPRWRRGAIMLAARFLRRRNSPSGVEAVGDMGVAYVSRKDPDVAQLLEIGPYRKPVVF